MPVGDIAKSGDAAAGSEVGESAGVALGLEAASTVALAPRLSLFFIGPCEGVAAPPEAGAVPSVPVEAGDLSVPRCLRLGDGVMAVLVLRNASLGDPASQNDTIPIDSQIARARMVTNRDPWESVSPPKVDVCGLFEKLQRRFDRGVVYLALS